MLLLPSDILALLAPFAALFSRRTWRHVSILVIGAILAPGRRMVSSALRAVGLAHLPTFQTYHRLLNRAAWSSLGASRILLHLLVATFASTGPLVLGMDETIERRHSQKIAATGIYRDPVRSSHSHFVKANGLRWICLMLLVPIPWAARVWALPFLTALAPSERYAHERGRRHKSINLWARQLIRLVHRWLPDRQLVVVGDLGYASLELLAAVRPVATCITRLRLDAHLCAPAPPSAPGQRGRPRLVGKRLPTLEHWRDDPVTAWTSLTVPRWYSQTEREVEVVSQTAVWYHTGLPPVPIRWVLIRDPQGKFATQALLCTDLEASPLQILSWFVLRWQMDEHRIGLKPLLRRVWTLPGHRPLAPVEPRYDWRYLVAFVHPTSGRTLWHLATGVSAALFSAELAAFAAAVGASPTKQIVLVLDQAGWHTSDDVVVPAHVHLLFLPAHSPELQPAEHLWQFSDAPLVNRHFRNIDELEDVQLARCAVLQTRRDLIRSATLFSWWPKRITKLK